MAASRILLVAACLAAAAATAVVLWRRRRQRPAPSPERLQERLQEPLPTVALETLASAASRRLAGPSLVSGAALGGSRDYSRWRTLEAYPSNGRPEAVLFSSPTGVFSSYSSDRYPTEEGGSSGVVFRPSSPAYRRDCREAYHKGSFYPWRRAFSLWLKALAGGGGGYWYCRHSTLDSADHKRLLRGLRLPSREATLFSDYYSTAGCVTNLHYDQGPGLLSQGVGRKRILLVSPEWSSLLRSPGGFQPSSPWFRRSRYSTPQAAASLPCPSRTVVVGPGETLFIPSGWWHQVTSLDTPTVGTILRFTNPPLLECPACPAEALLEPEEAGG